MKTFQDLERAKKKDSTEKGIMSFVKSVIDDHKNSEMYQTANTGYLYYLHLNETINNFKKILYKQTGEAIEDKWGANYKMACRHFYRFITQEVQFLLGNGITWQNEDTGDKLGNKKQPFDSQLQKLATKALWGGCAYGLYNNGRIDIFDLLEFAPLLDEENGSLRAGIRFWRIDETKPLRVTLYEEDGYTDMMYYGGKFKPSEDWEVIGKGKAIKKKRTYIEIKTGDQKDRADNTEILEGVNYPTFPIVPLWANYEHQSEIVGLQEKIDCYDLILSGFANNVDEAAIFYWTIKNAGGMDDVDIQKFIEQMKMLHASDLPEGTEATANTMDAPYQSRDALLNRLDKDLYRDAMALDVESLANGAVNETQIEASYEPLNEKVDMFEYCVLDFVYGILELAGIEDEPTFTRSMLANTSEKIQTLQMASANLPERYITEKILYYLGDGDKADEVLEEMQADEIARFSDEDTEEDTTEEEAEIDTAMIDELGADIEQQLNQ